LKYKHTLSTPKIWRELALGEGLDDHGPVVGSLLSGRRAIRRKLQGKGSGGNDVERREFKMEKKQICTFSSRKSPDSMVMSRLGPETRTRLTMPLNSPLGGAVGSTPVTVSSSRYLESPASPLVFDLE